MASSGADVIYQRAELHARNVNPEAQRKAFASKNALLTSDLKKATSLAKRFKNYSAEASEKVILMQLDTINFGMFFSEAAQCVVQSLCHGTKMKQTDVHSFALVCSEVHQRYEGFWPLVLKGLKDNAGEIISLEALRTAMERMDEAATAAATAGTTGDGNLQTPATTATSTVAATALSAAVTAGAATSGASSAPPIATAASGGGGGAMLQGKSPVEEFNRLRLVARVFCEWWLVGLLEDGRLLLKMLKQLHNLAEKKAASLSFPASIANLFSVTVLLIREVGIEMLGMKNMVFSCLSASTEKESVRLRDFADHCGALEVSPTRDDVVLNQGVFMLGTAGARLAFNTTNKSVGPVDETLAQHAEEMSWARLCSVRALPAAFYTRDDEKEQFAALVLASARTHVKVYEHLKKKLEGWWHSICEQSELRGKTARHAMEESQFRLFQEYLDRLYVTCDNLLGMLGFAPPVPVDLSVVEHKGTVDITFTSVTKRFYRVVNAETLNRFRDDDQRVFYEYIPDMQSLPDEFLRSLNMEKPNLNVLFGRKDLAMATTTATTAGGGGRGGDEEAEEMELKGLDTSVEIIEGGTAQHGDEAAAMMERRRLRLAELAVPASLFGDYAAVLQLLEGLDLCNTAVAIDEWCERFVQEAVRSLQHSPDSLARARLFFTNCRMLLLLELRYYPRARRPEMLPFMARCAAILHQYFPDTGEFLGGGLEEHWRLECKSHAAALISSSTSLSSPPLPSRGDVTRHRLVAATVRYLCELMKFGIISQTRVLNIMRTCVEELRNSCCAAVCLSIAIEHSGFFLLHSHATKSAMEKVLEKLRSAVRELGSEEKEKIKTLKGAFAFLRPLSSNTCQRPVQKERSPLERYMRHLLHGLLSPETYNFVSTKMLKMPWDKASHCEMLIRTLRKVHQVGWDAVPLVADLLADLARAGHERVAERIVDEVSEDMRRDLEVCVAEETSGICGNELHPPLGSTIHFSYRPMHWRIVDCLFVANLFRVRVVSFRFVCYILLLLLLYTPFITFPKNDYSRLRCCITLLDECIPLLPWKKSGTTRGTWRNGARSMGHITNLHQLVRKIMALIFLHRYSLTEPLPLDLCYRLEELVGHVNTRLSSSDHGACSACEGRGGDSNKRGENRCNTKGNESPVLQQSADVGRCNHQGNDTMKSSGLVLPSTLTEAHAYADAVANEAVSNANAWFEKLREAITEGSRGDALHHRIFSVRTSEQSLIYPITTPTSACGDDAIQASLGPLSVDALRVVVEDTADEETGDKGESSHMNRSTTPLGDSRSEGSVSDSSDVDSSDSECVSSTSSIYTGHATDLTYDDDDEEEEEEEEEVEEEEEEDDDDNEDEQEEQKFAAAEALRLQLEGADLDAKLRALMSENTRDVTCRVTSATAKGNVAERLIEQDLAMGIRLHRQQQQQQQQQNQQRLQNDVPPSDDSPGQEMRFVLLRRPIRTVPTVAKSGGVTAASASVAGSSSGAAMGVSGGSSNSCVAVLSIPRNSEFAKSALMQQEQQRHQQEELREITRRINRMQEAEGCGDGPGSRSTK